MSLINLLGSLSSVLALMATVVTTLRHRRLQQQSELIKTALPSDRARLVELALDRFGIDTRRLSQDQQAEIALERLRQRSERFRWGLIASTLLLVLSAGVLIANNFRDPGFYQIRVTVLGLEGRPTDKAELRTSVDGVLKQLPGGWELELPKAKRPAEGWVKLWATQGSLTSPPVEIELGEASTLSVELQLQLVEAEIRGLVVDETNEALSGARVFVVGYEHEEVVETSAGGSFVLNARTATGEPVRLRAEKDGYKTRDQTHPAGRAPVTLVLEAEPAP